MMDFAFTLSIGTLRGSEPQRASLTDLAAKLLEQGDEGSPALPRSGQPGSNQGDASQLAGLVADLLGEPSTGEVRVLKPARGAQKNPAGKVKKTQPKNPAPAVSEDPPDAGLDTGEQRVRNPALIKIFAAVGRLFSRRNR